ncbi:coxsackievirus and adenovirus receptor homolog [Anableps anableps]
MRPLAPLVCLQLILQTSATTLSVPAGSDALLPCRAPGGAAVTVLEWTKDGLPPDQYVYLHRNNRPYENYQHPSFRGRVTGPSSTRAGDASVVLRNATLEDAGSYRCRVLMSSAGAQVDKHEERIQLLVQGTARSSAGSRAAPARHGSWSLCFWLFVLLLFF